MSETPRRAGRADGTSREMEAVRGGGMRVRQQVRRRGRVNCLGQRCGAVGQERALALELFRRSWCQSLMTSASHRVRPWYLATGWGARPRPA